MERPRAGTRYPEASWRLPGVVPDRCRLLGLPGMARWQRRLYLPVLWSPRRMAAWRRQISIRGMRKAHLRDGRHHLRSDPHPSHSLVRRLLAFCDRERRHLGAELERTLEIGSYQTVWAMLHRLRSVLIRPDRERLSGRVEVDETYIGGQEPGLSGGRAQGKKVLTGIAVGILDPKGFGRCRMTPLADASAASLHPFVEGHIERIDGRRMVGRATGVWKRRDTSMTGTASVRPRRGMRTRANFFPVFIGSPPWPSDGCWALTREPWTLQTYPAT